MPEVTIIVAGTDCPWEDTAVYWDLKTPKRHNFDSDDEQLYLMLDGVGADCDDEHPELSTLYVDKEPPFQLKSRRAKDSAGHTMPRTSLERVSRIISGKGMKESAAVIRDSLLYLQKQGKTIDKINLIGFSRGGATCHLAAYDIYQEASLSNIPIDLFAVDPVPGPGNFNLAGMRQITPNVRKYLSLLATNEYTVGFEPLSEKYLNFLSKKTKYCFLPISSDHNTCLPWAKSLIRNFVPPALLGDDKTLATLKSQQLARASQSPQVRYKTYHNNPARYDRDLMAEATQLVDNYYQYRFKREVSLQDDSEIFPTIAKYVCRFLGIKRAASVNIDNYIDRQYFTNLHHQWAFKQAFPQFYALLDNQAYELEVLKKELLNLKTLKYASYFFERFHFKKLISELTIKDLIALPKIHSSKRYSQMATNLYLDELEPFMAYQDGFVNSVGFDAPAFMMSLKSQLLETIDFVSYPIQKTQILLSNLCKVRTWQTDLYLKSVVEPDNASEVSRKVAHSMVTKIRQAILSFDWNIRVGGRCVEWHKGSRITRLKVTSTCFDMLSLIESEEQKLQPDFERVLEMLAQLTKKRLHAFSPFRSQSSSLFYKQISRLCLAQEEESADCAVLA